MMVITYMRVKDGGDVRVQISIVCECQHSLRRNIATALRYASVSSAQANKCVVARIDHVATSCADSACGKETYAKWSLVMLAVSWRV